MAKRDYNIDLFRIIATIFVIILHVLGQGGVLKSTSPNQINYWGAWFMEILAYCAVNCFALISGYLMVGKTVKTKSIISLWLQVLFYSLLFSFLFFIFIPKTRTLYNFLIAFLPVVSKQWWYISSYFALFFFIPFLNAAIENIPKATFKKFLILILIGIGVLDCLVKKSAFAHNNGYSPLWLMLLYLFGAYMKKYDLKQKITALKSLLAFFASIVFTFLSKVIITAIDTSIYGKPKFENTFISYTSITITLAAVFLFLFCLNLKINSFWTKIIAVFSPATLGVYLIHVHPFVFKYIIGNSFKWIANLPPVLLLLSLLAVVISIFLLCSVVDLARIKLFKLIKINNLCELLNNKLLALYQKVFKA